MTMTTKEQIRQVLENWGFVILRESDNSLVFRYQLNYVQANVTEDDDTTAIALTLSGIFTADDDNEMSLGLRVCNELNYKLLQVKLYIDDDSDLIIASEFFSRTPEDLEYLIRTSLQSLVVSKRRFLQRYDEVEEEAKLLSELDTEQE